MSLKFQEAFWAINKHRS